MSHSEAGAAPSHQPRRCTLWTRGDLSGWFGQEGTRFATVLLPYLLEGDESDQLQAAGVGLTPGHLIKGMALCIGDRSPPLETSLDYEAMREVFGLLSEGFHRSPEQALLDIGFQLGERYGHRVHVRVLRNAPLLGIDSAKVRCDLVFALYAGRADYSRDELLRSIDEIVGLCNEIRLDDIRTESREALLAIGALARQAAGSF
jgi:hypothetical protein